MEELIEKYADQVLFDTFDRKDEDVDVYKLVDEEEIEEIKDEYLLRKKNALLKAKAKILRMRNSKEKVNLINSYHSLIAFYRKISGDYRYPLDVDIDYDFMNKYYKYCLKDTTKTLKELEVNSEKLITAFERNIDIFKQNELCEYKHITFSKCNMQKFNDLLVGFFASLGEDVLKIYFQMIYDRNICMLSKNNVDSFGQSFDNGPIAPSGIIVSDISKYIVYYHILAHEIGHCYQFKLQKNHRKYSRLDPYCEITSMLFEKLFLEYLRRNHVFDDNESLTLYDYKNHITNISSARVLMKILKEDKLKRLDSLSLKYELKGDNEYLKKEFVDGCGYFNPDKFLIETSDIHYAFGDIISTYFFDRLMEDFESGWKEFNDFIMNVNILPMKDVIDKYFNLDLVEKDVKNFIKSYR